MVKTYVNEDQPLLAPRDLVGRTAVITGSAGGIGAATARALAKQGSGVFLIDRNESVLLLRDELIAEGVAASAAVMDVGDEAAWASAAKQCATDIGAPDTFVSNAFVVDIASLEDTALPSWERQLRVNLTGAYLGSRTLMPHLQNSGRGAMVMVSSVHAHFGLPGRAAYATTKAGLTGLTRQLAAEYAPVRVNCVLPGPILTSAWDDIDQAGRDSAARSTALGRIGSPDEVAEAIAFLCSERASFITGVELPVDGGWSVTKDSA